MFIENASDDPNALPKHRDVLSPQPRSGASKLGNFLGNPNCGLTPPHSTTIDILSVVNHQFESEEE